MTPCITKSFILLRATLAFAPGPPDTARSASVYAGTNGIPKPPTIIRHAGSTGPFLSNGHRLASRGKERVSRIFQPARAAWVKNQRSHAIANGCFVAAVNRVGLEKPAGGAGIEFWGQSFVAAPSAATLARASADKEEILLACSVEFDQLSLLARTGPSSGDCRIDAYGDLAKRYID